MKFRKDFATATLSVVALALISMNASHAFEVKIPSIKKSSYTRTRGDPLLHPIPHKL